MLKNIFRISKEQILDYRRFDNYLDSDEYIRSLGPIDIPIIAFNPSINDVDRDLIYWLDDLRIEDKCLVLNYNDVCIAKIFPPYWVPDINLYKLIDINKIQYTWKKNSNLDKLMKFVNDPIDQYEFSPWDKDYELVWYLDPKVNPTNDKIWVYSARPLGRKIKGVKDMGFLSPDISIEYNESIPKFNFDLESNYPNYWDLQFDNVLMLDSSHQNGENLWAIKFSPNYRKSEGWRVLDEISPIMTVIYNSVLGNLDYDLDHQFLWSDFEYEHVWLLDRSYLNEGEDDIWAFKIKLSNDIKGTKVVGYISPKFNIEYNLVLKNLNYEIHYDFKWHDLKYEHVWLLDRRHMEESEEDLWAFKLKFAKKNKGSKNQGYISPTYYIEYNRDLPNFNYDINHNIPWYDLQYKNIWYLDEKYSNTTEKIWNIKISATDNIIGEKEVGIVVPLISNQLDVIFISYNEPNAEKNWQRVLEKAPWAKRVSGVSGIFNAHRAAAKLSSTDMFYVVDGDSYLTNDWKFDFQPGIFDRDCAYVWSSINPVNDLIYGYGGVKLFSKSVLLKKKKWNTLDMFTGIMKKIKVEEKISCVTMFNVDPFSTWRSAFRECVKLYVTNQLTKLNTWQTIGIDKKFGKYAIEGAKAAEIFAKENINDYNELLKINDFNWLKEIFKNNRNNKYEKQI